MFGMLSVASCLQSLCANVWEHGLTLGWSWRSAGTQGCSVVLSTPPPPPHTHTQSLYSVPLLCLALTRKITAFATLPHSPTRQAVAMLPHTLVHLVAGAQCRAGAVCGRIVTTIENRDARGSVYAACSGTIARQVALGTLRETRTNCSWVWHNSTGYLLPADTDVMLTNGAEPSIEGAHVLFSLAITHTPR
jgi:hypothetical protein